MSQDLIPEALSQYFNRKQAEPISLDGKIKPYDYNQTNLNRLTNEPDRVGRNGWCYLGDGIETLTIGGSFSIDAIIADVDSGSGFVSDQDISGILSGRVLTFASGVYYKNIRAYVTSIDAANLRFKNVSEEESGTIAYDISGNGNHGTLSTTNLHSQNDHVTFSDAYDRGFTLNGLVVVPLLEDLSTDAAGNPIQYLGKYKPYLQVVDSPCFTSYAPNTYIETSDSINENFFKDSSNFIACGFSFKAATPTASNLWRFTSGTFANKLSVGVIYTNSSGHLQFVTTDGTIGGSATTTTIATNYCDNNWHRVFVVVDYSAWVVNVAGGTVTFSFYVDGVLVGSRSISPTSAYSNTQTGFGFYRIGDLIEAQFVAAYYYKSNTDLKTYASNDNNLVLQPDWEFVVPFVENAGTKINMIASDPTKNPNLQIENSNGLEWVNTQDIYSYSQSKGVSVSDGSGSVPLGGLIPSALDSNGNSTGLDVEGNTIPDGHLIGRGLRLNTGESIDINPENLPALTQMVYPSNDTDNIIEIDSLGRLFSALKFREETDNILTNGVLFDYGIDNIAPCLNLTTATSNTITLSDDTGVVSVSINQNDNPATFTYSSGVITITGDGKVFELKLLNGSGDVIDTFSCCEGAGSIINSYSGNLTATVGGTLTNIWSLTQKQYNFLKAYGGTISTGAGAVPVGGNIPSALNNNNFPTGQDVEGNDISEPEEVIENQQALALIQKI